MRIPKLSFAAAGVALALTASACDQGLTGLNENPNAPTNVGPQFLFPQGAVALVTQLRSGMDQSFTSLWSQLYAAVQYPEEDQYRMRPTNIDTWFQNLYSGGLQDMALVIENAAEADEPNLAAPAMIMRQWAFGLMTAIWGDIPYSQANMGAENTTPVYDSQEEIFAGMFSALDAASGMIDPAGEDLGTADPIYGGDLVKWQKFANSLRLRYAIWIADVAPGVAQAEFEDALSAPGGVFESNADNAVLVYPGDGQYDAPLYDNMVDAARDDHRVSKTLVDIMQSLDDPRLPVYANPATGTGAYAGTPNGLSADDAAPYLSTTSRIGSRFWEADAEVVLMDYAEVELLIAEGARRGWAVPTGTAATHYAAGVTAALAQYDVPAGEIAAYLSTVAFNPATAETQIALQLWLSYYGQGAEAWTMYRITGVPNLQPGPAAEDLATGIPARLTYPSVEQSLNGANLAAAIAAQGPDEMDTLLWFDVD